MPSPQRLPPSSPALRPEPDPEIERVRKVAHLLDQRYVDPILGFFLPGAGDLIGSMLGMYTVTLAARRKLSPVIIARMLINLALDAALGVVPFVGDLVDVGFKAHTKNVALLGERAEAGGRATARDWLQVAGAGLLFVGVLAGTIYAVVAVLRAVA